jgi:hypothetical protein
MAEHTGGKPRLLDFGILVHHAADPAQIDVHRPDRPATKGNAGGGAIVGNGIDDLAHILQTRIDDFDRRHDIFRGAQHVGDADARPDQPLAHDESEFDLNARLAIVGVIHLGAVGDHLVVENKAEIRFVDHRRALHRLRRESHFVTDELGARLDLAVRHFGGDGVGILDRDAGKGDVQLDRLFAFLLRVHQDIGRRAAVRTRKHPSPPRFL